MDKVERYGVAMEVCPGCHGVWLSQDKIEQIIG
jgi:Zn-finger nucleic acid-binding protein